MENIENMENIEGMEEKRNQPDQEDLRICQDDIHHSGDIGAQEVTCTASSS